MLPEQKTSFNEMLVDFLKNELPDGPNKTRVIQTGTNLHKEPSLKSFFDFVQRQASVILQDVNSATSDICATGAWANLSFSNLAHPEHTHQNNYLSAVYYAAAPTTGTSICFIDPRPQSFMIAPPFTEQNSLNSSEFILPITAGMLIFFPSWLPHSVIPSKSKSLRISISINYMFKNFEEEISPTDFSMSSASTRGLNRIKHLKASIEKLYFND